jgi:voltage-gated potassium channel
MVFQMKRKLLYSIIALAGVVLFGTVGFTLVEKTVGDPFEALYFTIVTMTTVGYGDIVPTSGASRVIASIVMIGGIGAGLTTLQSLFDATVRKELRQELGLPERRTKMRDHYIICGFGNVGRQIADQLKAKGDGFIVIERDRDKVSSMIDLGLPVIVGDATQEEVLQRANVSNAKALITTMTDSTNIVVVITAKMLNPNLHIVSEVEDYHNSAKLRKAGADEVVHCHEMGARMMVSKARKTVLDPVCGMEIDPAKAEYAYEYEGEKYYFSDKDCMTSFQKNPKRYIEMQKVLEATCGVP